MHYIIMQQQRKSKIAAQFNLPESFDAKTKEDYTGNKRPNFIDPKHEKPKEDSIGLPYRGRGRGQKAGRGRGRKRNKTHNMAQNRNQFSNEEPSSNFRNERKGSKDESDQDEFYDATESVTGYHDGSDEKWSNMDDASARGASGYQSHDRRHETTDFQNHQPHLLSTQHHKEASYNKEESQRLQSQRMSPDATGQIVVTGFGPSTDEEIIMMYFENVKKSGGGSIKDIELNSSDNSATITFKDSTVVRRVVGRTHSLLGCTMSVVEMTKEQSSTTETEVRESSEVVLEVSGFKAGTTEEMLSMYFESTRRSGGDEVIKVEVNEAKNNATITFADESVIDRVLRKVHRLQDITLTVSKKTLGPARPIDHHRIFLRGLPDGILEETLMLFVENRTGIPDEPDVVYGEDPGTAMLYYEEKIKDLDRIIRRFSGKKLNGVEVIAQTVQITNCVLVQGLERKISDDMLELYFENERRSGGGPVNDVKLYDEDNIAIIGFEDYTTVSRVVSRQHKLSGQTLTATAHYEYLGTSISTDGPVPVVPNPITQTVDADIMEYIISNDASSLEREMRKYNTEVAWSVNSNKSKVTLKPLVTEECDPGIWKKWNDTSKIYLRDFLQKFSKDAVPVPASLWSDLSEALLDLDVGTVDFLLQDERSIVILVGAIADVRKAKEDVLKTVNELQVKADRDAETIDRKLKLLPLKMKLFSKFGILPELQEKFPNVDISLSPESNELVFKGIRGEISEAQVTMYSVFESLQKGSFEGSQHEVEFVGSFCDFINEMLLESELESLCDVEEGKITVYSRTSSKLQNSLDFLNIIILSNQMPIHQEAAMKVLQSKKGSDKINAINDGHNVVMRLDMASQLVRITGTQNTVDAAVVEIGQFLEENVVIEKTIKLPSLHIEYITQYCGKELSDIQKLYPDVSVEPGKDRFIVKGNEKRSDVVVQKLDQLKSKIGERQHVVDKPGIPDLLRGQKGKRALQNIAKNCECVIRSDHSDEADSMVPKVATIGSPSAILCYVTVKGCRLLVCKGDLTKENVDGIVNAANQDLQHVGGLAKAIVQAGGETIQQESSRIRAQRGRKIRTGEVVCTGAGRLPCQYVLHVPGPMWPKYRRHDPSMVSHEENLLYDAVTNCLKQASQMKLTSIAFPAISSGVYGFPLDLCAKTVVEAVLAFTNKSQSTLREIRFTNVTVQHSVAFQKALTDSCRKDVVEGAPSAFKGDSTDGVPKTFRSRTIPAKATTESSAARATTSNLTTLFSKQGADTIATKEGLRIILKRGTIASEQADVIVNTAAADMVLSRGAVSAALLQAAGTTLQTECDVQVLQVDGTRGEVAPGDFIETGPGNIACKKVFHLNCPSYNDKNSAKILRTAVKKILTQAGNYGVASVGLPAIGTGNLGFPRDVTARVMYDTVAQFSRYNPSSSVKDVRFWVYDKDQPTIQAFETEIQKLTTATSAGSPDATKGRRSTRKMKKSASLFSLSIDEPPSSSTTSPETTEDSTVGVYSASSGISEIQFGSVTVRLQQGDLVQESADAIVNTVGRDLSLKGVVSKALIRAGGRIIEEECRKIRSASSTVPHIAVTTAGKLPCKSIIHVTLSGPDKVKHMTKEILQLTERSKMQSVAFPALGTGNIGGSPDRVAPDLIDAIGEFVTKENPKNVQLVKLVIFQQDMVPVFEETLKAKAGMSYKKSEGLIKRGIKKAWGIATGGVGGEATKIAGKKRTINPSPVDDTDSITLFIVSDSGRKLDEAVKNIEEYIKEEFHSEELKPDGEVMEFTENILQSIIQLARGHGVRVVRKPGNKSIRLEGAKVPVMTTKADIHTLFARIQREEKRKAEYLLLAKEVQWRYKTDTGLHDNYDQEINSLIERAYRDKKPFIDLDMEDGKIRIDLFNMIEKDLTGMKPDMGLHRADLKAENKHGVLPSTWIPMPDKCNIKVVPLVQISAEYTKVEQTFKAGYQQGTIVKIERIQNKELYTQYAARKESMQTKLGRDTENILYHGTSKDTLDKINMRGFNRSFCGKNAVMFGQGTYFARDAKYSAQDRYANRDAKNQKYMYMCKVLVGDCELGDSTIIVPHQKPNSHDIYDSTVDNVQNPRIVVIYHDAQAYPEYLITFT